MLISPPGEHKKSVYKNISDVKNMQQRITNQCIATRLCGRLCIYLTIRLRARDFYGRMINYNLIEMKSELSNCFRGIKHETTLIRDQT